jgi:hypothetical protein
VPQKATPLNGPKTVLLISNDAFASPISRTARQKHLPALKVRSVILSQTLVLPRHYSAAACRIAAAIFSVAANENRKFGDFMNVAAGAFEDALKAERTASSTELAS